MATTNLGLTTLAGTEKLKEFKTPYNDNLAKIDAVGGSALKSGTNSLGSVILAGYNTGSGNYVDACVPIIRNGKTITGVSMSSDTIVYTPTGRVDFSSAPTVTILSQNDKFVRIEVAYPSTQTKNISVTLYAVNLQITCS